MAGKRHFTEMLEAKWQEGKLLGIGIDSEFKKIPQEICDSYWADPTGALLKFNTDNVIWPTHDLVCSYMLNENFYKAKGILGILALQKTIERIHAIAPTVPVVLGLYGGDVGHSNAALAEYAFDYLDADAITINPYFGQDALQSLLDFKNKGIIVLCRTSNQGAGEFQDLVCQEELVPLYRTVAWRVATYWNEKNRNCALLIGPTYHGELVKIRDVVSHLPIFVTGIGTQQNKTGRIEEDDIKEIVVDGRNGQGSGLVVCSSRAVIFSPNPRQEAQRLHALIGKYLAEPKE